MLRPTKSERKKYKVDYIPDNVFSAYARLLQSKWREEKGYSLDKGMKYGNYIDLAFAKETKSNYLTENIRQLVTEEIINAKKNKALIGEPRIWYNLLSSQPLCFNLFGELNYDLDLATRLFRILFPERVEKVTGVKFEYSPGRGNSDYTGDHSAFDVFIEYTNKDIIGFIGIEVKYAESLKEETKEKAEKNFRQRYVELTNSSNKFIPDNLELLKQPPLSQIWRDHLLCIATEKDYAEGFFVFLFPSLNTQCQKGVDNYKTLLAFDNEEQTGFYPRHLEEFINTLCEICDAEWAKELKNRYLG